MPKKKLTPLMKKYKEETEKDPRKKNGEPTKEYKKWRKKRRKKKKQAKEEGKKSGAEKSLSTEVERLSAQVEAMGKLRESYDSRFTLLSERIGEVRSMANSATKELGKVRARAERAVNLVEEAEPEVLMTEVKRKAAEVDKLRGRIDALDIKLDTLTSDVKDLRRDVVKLTGVEDILELAEDMKNEITAAEKVKSEIKSRSDKVTAIFTELHDRLGEMERMKSKVNDLTHTTTDLSKSVTELDTKVEALPDFKEVNERIAGLEETVEKLKPSESESSEED